MAIMDKVSTRMLIDEVKKNMFQLLQVGIFNSDEHIKQVHGSERGLLELLKGYQCLLEDLTALWEREQRYFYREDTK